MKEKNTTYIEGKHDKANRKTELVRTIHPQHMQDIPIHICVDCADIYIHAQTHAHEHARTMCKDVVYVMREKMTH